MRARVPPRGRAAELARRSSRELQPDHQIADVGAGRPGVHQIAAGRERARRSRPARRQRSASSSASASRAQVSASTSAPASSVTPSVPSVPAASNSSSACPAISRAAASARCWLRPPRPGCGGSCTVDSPPHTHSCAADSSSSWAKRAASRASHRRRSAPAARARAVPSRGRRRARLAAHGLIDARRPRARSTCDRDRRAAGPMRPEPMTARIVVRHVRYEQRPRLRGRAAGAREPAALDARAGAAARVELADGDAAASAARGECLEVRKRRARLQHLHQARSAAGDQKQRLHLRPAAPRPSRAAARRRRASARRAPDAR